MPGPAARLDSFATEQLTHLIFSFGHLQGNRLHIASGADTACIQKMVSFKTKNQQLKVILSLGGWGGCCSCSSIFNSADDRKEFALSVKKELSEYFKTDGIDIDWEYPAIAGHPGHPYASADRKSFTLLLKQLQNPGQKQEISFAAGGFNSFIDSSVQWKKPCTLQIKYTWWVTTWCMVSAQQAATIHRYTPPCSRKLPQKMPSAGYLQKKCLPKIVMGAAFYARMFWWMILYKGIVPPGRFTVAFPMHICTTASVYKGICTILGWQCPGPIHSMLKENTGNLWRQYFGITQNTIRPAAQTGWYHVLAAGWWCIQQRAAGGWSPVQEKKGFPAEMKD